MLLKALRIISFPNATIGVGKKKLCQCHFCQKLGQGCIPSVILLGVGINRGKLNTFGPISMLCIWHRDREGFFDAILIQHRERPFLSTPKCKRRKKSLQKIVFPTYYFRKKKKKNSSNIASRKTTSSDAKCKR